MTRKFSERLRRFRQEKKLTQQELADALGVSNKTVSRWETEGGYPDVELLVPLVRILGVTVDALLDENAPARELGRTDWQNLLSYAFALGGGALFFLLDLFMPLPVCYLAYIGCMAYGVYLQRYYTYHSRFFLGANIVMNASVNLTLCARVGVLIFGWLAVRPIDSIVMEGMAEFFWSVQRNLLYAAGAMLLPALALTAATHWTVRVWSETGKLPGAFHVWDMRDNRRRGDGGLRLSMERPRPRQAVSAAIPLLACGYWFLSCSTPPLLPKIEEARPAFALLLAALAVLFTFPLLKKGFRRWIPLQWGMTALCWQMADLVRYAYWLPRTQAYYPAWEGKASNASVSIIGRAGPGTVALALCLAAAWVILGCARLRWKAGPQREAAQTEDAAPEEDGDSS